MPLVDRLPNNSRLRERVSVRPLPDENVYSILARSHIRFGCRSSLSSLKKFTSARGYKPQSGLPTRLIEIQRRVNLPITAEALAYHHTDFPLYTHFVGRRRCSNIKRDMLFAGSSKSRLGLLRSHVGAGDTRRFCVDCAKHDVFTHGHPFWRRGYSLPGFLVCPIHRAPLVEMKDPESVPHERVLELPQLDLDQLTLDSDLTSLLSRIASCYVLLTKCHHRFQFDATFYKRFYDDLGLLTDAGSVRQRQVCLAARELLRKLSAYDPFDRLLSATDIERSWIASLADCGRGFHHPLKHIVVWLSFELSPQDVFNIAHHTHHQMNLNLELADDRMPDAEIADKFASSRSITQAAKRLGWSANTAVAWAERNSIPFVRRPKKVTDELRTQIVEFCKVNSTAVAAKRFKLSIPTINRIRRASRS